MGRLTVGMLVALSMLLAAGPAAHGAEIPPSAKCSMTLKKLLKQNVAENSRATSKKERRQSDRKALQGLVDAGCLSDAEPLLKKVPLRRNSEVCANAAEATGKRWNKPTVLLKTMFNKLEAKSRPIERRLKQVERKINRLAKRGASAKRLRPLRRAEFRSIMRLSRLYSKFGTKAVRLVQPRAFETFLIYLELASLRCVSQNMNFLREDAKAVGPAEAVVKKNVDYFSLSLLLVAMQMDPDISRSGDASASSVALRRLPELAEVRRRLPLID